MWTESPPKADIATKTGMIQLHDPSILSPTVLIIGNKKIRIKRLITEYEENLILR